MSSLHAMKKKPMQLIVMLALFLSLIAKTGCNKDSKPTKEDITNSIGMKLTYIPSGTFWMGRRDRTDVNQWPRHSVRLTRGFYISTTEVTQDQWSQVTESHPWAGMGNVKEGGDYPVIYISWDMAAAFCDVLSEKEGRHYRLPTEAEWEYACRAGTRTAYSFGDDVAQLGDYAWFRANTSNDEYAHAVAKKKPNPWGLYDIHGNVWEWCSDWYGDYPEGPVTNPHGPGSGDSHVMRGGSWFGGSEECKSTVRPRTSSDNGMGNVGFRVVLDEE